MRRRDVPVAVAAMLATAAGAELARPTRRLADIKPPIALEAQVPRAFGEWRLDPNVVPVQPAPDVQAKLDAVYTQVLARTYVNDRGERVMLSIAYGSDQGTEATAVHRPEFCYTSQGFRVRAFGNDAVAVAGGVSLPVRRLEGSFGMRVEPILYWVTLDEKATVPGLGRKLAQIEYGLRGEIPDGMLVRVSSIERDDRERAFALQRRFITALSEAVEPGVRARYFGS